MRAPTRRLPPAPAGAAGRTRIMQMELEQFASKLQALRIAKDWSQSDLAREVWGETETRAGRKVAKNRDRISTYEMGKSWPDPHNLTKIANALGVSPEELAPDITAATVERQNPEIAVIAVAGHADKVHLKVNKLVPMSIATLIMQLLDYANLIAHGLANPHEQPSLNLPEKLKVKHLSGDALREALARDEALEEAATAS
jgi:transcriptional regulator with XRE-family HTH domain